MISIVKYLRESGESILSLLDIPKSDPDYTAPIIGGTGALAAAVLAHGYLTRNKDKQKSEKKK